MTSCPVCKGSTIIITYKDAKVFRKIFGGEETEGREGQIYETSEDVDQTIDDLGTVEKAWCEDCGYESTYREEFIHPPLSVGVCVFIVGGVGEENKLFGIYEVTNGYGIDKVKGRVQADLPERVEMGQIKYFGLDPYFGIRALRCDLDSSTNETYRRKLLSTCRVYQEGVEYYFK